MMNFHDLFGTHRADLKASRWDGGWFVSRCTACGAAMIKPPGLQWQLRTALTG